MPRMAHDVVGSSRSRYHASKVDLQAPDRNTAVLTWDFLPYFLAQRGLVGGFGGDDAKPDGPGDRL